MLRFSFVLCILLAGLSLFSQNWSAIKDTVRPEIILTEEFDTAYRQPLAGLGWEDGVHISADGLHLYCTYVPIDLLSFVLNGSTPDNFSADYLRGAPDFGMDLLTNPIGADEWLHSDILYAQRNSQSEAFSSWQLSALARDFYSEGALAPSEHTGAADFEFMLFTSNDSPDNNTDIWFIKSSSVNPAGPGSPFPDPVNTTANEDNPNLTRINNDTLVLFFDSDNLPGGTGDNDLWYSISTDNALSWSTPANVTSVNSSEKEHQPFLHYDLLLGNWFLYYSAPGTDGKLAIYRRKQTETANWNSWGEEELVISAGNSAGIGEPTLTKNGDISFVLIYDDPSKTSIYNRYDSDPWFLMKIPEGNSGNHATQSASVEVFPNPASHFVTINSEDKIELVKVYNCEGKLLFTSIESTITISELNRGVYILQIKTETGQKVFKKLLKQ